MRTVEPETYKALKDSVKVAIVVVALLGIGIVTQAVFSASSDRKEMES